MNTTKTSNAKSTKKYVLLTASAVMLITLLTSLWICYRVMLAEAHVRYVGVMNKAAEKVNMTMRSLEMNAKNVFDEVSKHLDSPEAVIEALQSKTSLNPEVKGYFAAFEPEYFPQEGRWFEPYVHHQDSSQFVVNEVGSENHDYTSSPWYIQAKNLNAESWCDPYYYEDNDEIGLSGLYCTFSKPVFDAKGRLACICGADITLEWLAKKLRHIDESARTDGFLNIFHKGSQEMYTAVINHDGSAIAHPEGKPVTITDPEILGNLKKQLSGMKDLTVNGVPARIYYSPLEDISWSVALVVPKEDIWRPLLLPAFLLLLTAAAGILIISIVLKKFPS